MLTWATPRFLRQTIPPIEPLNPPNDDKSSLVNSGLDEQVGEKLPRKRDERVSVDEQKLPTQIQRGIPRPVWSISPENEETRPGVQEILQRKGGQWVPDDDQKLPRKQSTQILGDITDPRVDPTLGSEEDANHPSNIEPERQPRKNGLGENRRLLG